MQEGEGKEASVLASGCAVLVVIALLYGVYLVAYVLALTIFLEAAGLSRPGASSASNVAASITVLITGFLILRGMLRG